MQNIQSGQIEREREREKESEEERKIHKKMERTREGKIM